MLSPVQKIKNKKYTKKEHTGGQNAAENIYKDKNFFFADQFVPL